MKDKMKKLYQRKTVLKIHNNKKYKCYDPKESISPLGYEFIETVHDDDTYIIARIKRPQDENPCLAVRWYIESSEYECKADSEKICTDTRIHADTRHGSFCRILCRGMSITI